MLDCDRRDVRNYERDGVLKVAVPLTETNGIHWFRIKDVRALVKVMQRGARAKAAAERAKQPRLRRNATSTHDAPTAKPEYAPAPPMPVDGPPPPHDIYARQAAREEGVRASRPDSVTKTRTSLPQVKAEWFDDNFACADDPPSTADEDAGPKSRRYG